MLYLDEKEILQKLSEGDSVAFSQVVNVYHKRLMHFTNHYINDYELARDVVQDVFSIVWESHEKFSEVNNLSSWLYTLTKNQCLKKIDYLKVRQKYSEELKNRELETAKSALDELDTSPITFNEINSIIAESLQKLAPQTRKIFELSRYENKKNQEIALELNISIKTVEANVTKALKILRKALKNYMPLVFF